MKVIEEPQLAVKRKLPWLIDVFIYPTSISGIIHLVIFLGLPPIVWSLFTHIPLLPFFIFIFLVLGFYMLFVGYIFYYLAYCVVDSAKGGRRAPDISIYRTPSKGELISQLLCVFAGLAFCFWPAGVYYAFRETADAFFWFLLACGMFFLPMALLAVLMFDSLDALNPIMIIKSIYKTFFTYIALVPFFFILGGLATIIIFRISDLFKPQSLRQLLGCISLVLGYIYNIGLTWPGIVFIYLAMVGAHLLGCFYWWHKDKLDWGL